MALKYFNFEKMLEWDEWIRNDFWHIAISIYYVLTFDLKKFVLTQCFKILSSI